MNLRFTGLITLALTGCPSPNATCLAEVIERIDADQDGYILADDCDDSDPSIHPAAFDACDGIDNDCNGVTDDAYPDVDGDGEADCAPLEVCDGLDNDGDGAVDELEPDFDGDGVADCIDDACDVPTEESSLVEMNGDCEGSPEVTDPWDGQVAWQGAGRLPVRGPYVAQLLDLDSDGDVDSDDPPTVLITEVRTGFVGITLLDGRDGSSAGSIPLTTYNYMALADVDGDGAAEIFTDDEGVVVRLDADGTEVWRDTVRSGPTIAIADLDGDGDAEIFCGGRALNSSDGSLIFALTESYLSRDPAIGDLDLDGTQEIIYGDAVWDSTGAKLYDLPVTLSEAGYWPAIIQADSDPEPEILLVLPDSIAVIEHDGVVISENSLSGSSGSLSGAPTVADLDGDGQVEVAFYEPRSSTFPRIVAFELDGTAMWSTVGAGLDGSSDPSGVCSFDFDNDGAHEVVSSTPIGLRILDGATGAERYSISGNWAGIFDQVPIVADVDGDGSAEIATLARTSASTGVIVVEQASNTWPSTEAQWTQFGWAAGKFDADGTAPSAPTYWQDHNVWRGQSPVNESGVDLRVKISDVCVSSCDEAVGVAAVAISVSNYGTQSTIEPVTVSLYRSDAGTLTWLDSQTLAGLDRAERSASLVFDLPITDLGSEGLVARVDASETSPDGTVRECDEANNEDTWAYSVCP